MLQKSPRLKGSRAKGKAFERKTGRHLKRMVQAGFFGEEADLRSEQWIYFKDENGTGWCQPDHFIATPERIFLFECKLTQSDVADVQLKQLYSPCLKYIYKRDVLMIQVFRNMRYHPGAALIETPVGLRSARGVLCWHYLP